MGGNVLVIVDPQNDFCDQRGSLYVEGAAGDIARLSRFIEREGESFSDIFVSLDSHDSAAIFHPGFWVNDRGERPEPFTQIAPGDYRAGSWRVRCARNRPFAERTFSAMETKGVERLMIWPEHCVISTWGHQIADPLRDALRGWRELTGRAARYIFKGENPYTDQFSIFEGVDGSYPETSFNEPLFSRLAAFETVTFAGEALSHCVQESIISYARRAEGGKQTLMLLTDCTSPVGGFSREASLALLGGAGIGFAAAGE